MMNASCFYLNFEFTFVWNKWNLQFATKVLNYFSFGVLVQNENQKLCTLTHFFLDSYLVMQYIECLRVRWQRWHFFKTVQQ